MRQESYSSAHLRKFLRKIKVANLQELKSLLGTKSTMTVFRKLKILGYQSSYSHRGKYYTLESIPDFDKNGLWSWHKVWFSKYGNLVETTKELVEGSDCGFSARELESILHVESKRSLFMLHEKKQLVREKIGGVLVYFSKKSNLAQRQKQERLRLTAEGEFTATQINPLADELKAAIVLFFSLLDEQQRRLYAGLEAYKIGLGGDRTMAKLLGVNAHTVSRGREELFTGDIERGRVRQKGGGRISAEKKRRKSSPA